MTTSKISLFGCSDCGKKWYTDYPRCPYCMSIEFKPLEVEGTGTLYSWVTIHRSLENPPRPVPYTIVTVDLDAGARVNGRLDNAVTPVANAPVECMSMVGNEMIFSSRDRSNGAAEKD